MDLIGGRAGGVVDQELAVRAVVARLVVLARHPRDVDLHVVAVVGCGARLAGDGLAAGAVNR